MGDEFATAANQLPVQAVTQAAVARLARWILYRVARGAPLQLEATLGGGRRHIKCHAAAMRGRQQRQARPHERILAPWPRER